MTPNTTHAPETRPAPYAPAFDTPPGACVSGSRTLWELGRWMVELRGAFLVIAFVGCLIAGTLGGAIFVAGFLAAASSDSTINVLNRKGAAHALGVLPLHSKQIVRLVWAMAVSGLPLVYGCIQVPVRLLVLFGGTGDFDWFVSIVPECVFATGLASLAFLGRTMAPWSGAREGVEGKSLYVLGQALLGIAYFSAFGIGWILNHEEGIRHPAYFGAIAASIALATVSYRVAPYTWDSARQTRRESLMLGRGASRHASPARFVDFFGLWIRPTLWVTGYLAFMCLIMAAAPYVMGGQFDSVLSSDSVVYYFVAMPFILLVVYVQQHPQVEYRLIRTLPLRRSHQALLILTFGLPLTLPLAALVIASSFVFDWPLMKMAAFVIAFVGCCEFALILWPTIGILGVLATALLSAPLVIMVSSWHSPWALAVYVAFAAVLWVGSYAYLYQQLCGDGALYGKRDVIADVVAGRE